ncbi:MAG TPA: hypothetical protein DCQ31_19185, partial [Bacteroidales bacterium]|nr:hypothetical protein [Bacteroidales bacterium]
VSAGNWLGALTGYALGYAGNWQKITKFTGVKQEKVEKFRGHVIKYGPLLAFFTWLPGIGDPITVALGFFRTGFWSTAIIILLGKVARYIVFGLMVQGAINSNYFVF